MKIEKRDAWPKVGKRRVEKFERDTGITLPTDYRDFLLKHNGGLPVDSRFEIPDIREDSQVEFFYPIDNPDYGNLEEQLAEWKSEMPPGFLPIACDPGGAIIIMGTADKYTGKVYFWDHQHTSLYSSHERNTYLVASSFTEFVGSLKPDDGPSRWGTDVPKAADLIKLTLSRANGIQPIQMARLATEFAKVANPEKAVAQILKKLFGHKSADVRRVGIGAARRIKAFDVPGLEEALVKKLADPDGWVRYDAAWAIRDAGYDGKDVRKALTKLAKDVVLPRDEEAKRQSSDPVLYARVEARMTLDALLAKP